MWPEVPAMAEGCRGVLEIDVAVASESSATTAPQAILEVPDAE